MVQIGLVALVSASVAGESCTGSVQATSGTPQIAVARSNRLRLENMHVLLLIIFDASDDADVLRPA
jgi:hypothetical protein